MQAQPIPKLPFWKTVGDSFVLTLRYAGTFARYAWPALVFLVLAGGVMYWAYFPVDMRLREESADFRVLDILASFAVPMLSLLVGAMVAVPWHRFLIENHTPHASDASPVARRTLVYLFWVIAGLIPVLLAAMPTGIIAATLHGVLPEDLPFKEYGLAALFCVFMTPFFRFSLVYPARAVGNGSGLWTLFQLTKGNAMRLAAGTVLATLPSMLMAFAMETIFSPAETQDRLTYVVRMVTGEVAFMISGMTIVTFLSLAYRHLVMPPPTSAPAGA